MLAPILKLTTVDSLPLLKLEFTSTPFTFNCTLLLLLMLVTPPVIVTEELVTFWLFRGEEIDTTGNKQGFS